jgi:small ligand-binding sensory domain FIST
MNEIEQTGTIHFSSAATKKPHLDEALNEITTSLLNQMAEQPIDFAQVFLTPHFRSLVNSVIKRLQAGLKPKVLIGCTAESVIGQQHEIEHSPAIAVVTAHLPGVELIPFKLQSMNWESILSQAEAFRQQVPLPEDPKLIVLLCDPFTTPIDRILTAFNTFYPDLPLVGGVASGAYRAGGNALLFNDTLLNNGAVGVAIGGPLEVDVIVSQGCRPIGPIFTVSEARENVILGLDGQPPLLHLQKLITALPPADQALLRNGLLVGRAINPEQESLGRGDFLIRGVIGADQESGALVIGDYPDVGERLQFHLRDAGTAAEDLEMMLSPQLLFDPPAGALLYSCNGRGTRLYDHPDGDISIIHNVLGAINLAGFFCAGEIGPIGGKNFLHGHTASLALFRPVGDGQ